MHRPLPGVGRGRVVPSVAIVLVALFVVGCSTASAPAASTGGGAGPGGATTGALASIPTTATEAPSAAAASAAAPSAPPAGGASSAAAWCDLVIEISTKAGYMKDKHIAVAAPSMDIQRQIVDETVSRGNEWIAKSPPEIKDATAADVAYSQALKAYGDVHGWTDPAGFPAPTAAQLAALTALLPFEEKQCGITLGK